MMNDEGPPERNFRAVIHHSSFIPRAGLSGPMAGGTNIVVAGPSPTVAFQRNAREAIKAMKQGEFTERHVEANRHDGEHVSGSLNGGLAILRDSLYGRVHRDVEIELGKDTMIMPVSEMKTEASTKTEIDLYQIAESAAAVGEHGYVRTDARWYLQWLTRLRLGEAATEANTAARLDDYMSRTPDDRRLAFTDVLATVLAESTRAPLVLFRLFPLSVEIATALAFGDHAAAQDARNRQTFLLPEIGYCNECHGKVLENGEQCPGCGNPLWKYEWLTAAD